MTGNNTSISGNDKTKRVDTISGSKVPVGSDIKHRTLLTTDWFLSTKDVETSKIKYGKSSKYEG